MADYSKGVIYIITVGDDFYVGSTIDLETRESSHNKKIYNENCSGYNYNLYKRIRENNGNYCIEIYKHFPCENVRELEQEEQRVMDELKPTLNGQRAYLTDEERVKYFQDYHKKNYQENKEMLKQKWKDWYSKNKEKVNERERLKANKKVNCPFCNKEMNYSTLSRHKKKWCKSKPC